MRNNASNSRQPKLISVEALYLVSLLSLKTSLTLDSDALCIPELAFNRSEVF